MGLHIIYGRGGSGKTTTCLAQVEGWLAQDNSQIVWMVPEQYSMETERMLSRHLEVGVMARVDVLSFERMAKRVFSMVGPALCDYIDESGKQMLMERALLEVGKQLTVLAKAARQNTFPAQMLTLCNELKRNGITPAALRQTASVMELPTLKFKLTDLALVFQAYEKQFSAPWMDTEDDMSRLVQKIEQNKLFSNCYVVVDHFDSFTPNQMQVLQQLLGNAKQMTVALLCDDIGLPLEGDTFGRAKHAAQLLMQAARAAKVDIIPATGLANPKGREGELAHLEENYFAYPPTPYEKPTQAISMHGAANYEAEADYIARQMRRLCREQGYRYRDMAVLSHNGSNYEPLLRAAFYDYDIPCYLGRNTSPMDCFVVRGLLCLFEIVGGNFRGDAIFRWIKSGMCGITHQQACLLENYVLAAGNTATLWKREGDWTYAPGFSEEQMEQINQLKELVRGPIVHFMERFTGRKTVTQLAAAYQAFLEEVHCTQQVQTHLEQLEKRGELQQADYIEASYNGLVDTINQMVLLLGDKQVTFEKFASILQAGIGGLELGSPPATVDAPTITDVERFRGQGAKCVFLMGMTDGVFPGGYIGEGLLSDQERTAIQQVTGVTMETTLSRQEDQNSLIYSAITAPGQRLYLTYPLADQDGKKLLPSSVIGRMEVLFPQITQTSDLFANPQDDDLIEGVLPTFRQLVFSTPTGVWSNVEAWYAQQQPQLHQVLQRAKNYTNQPAALREDMVHMLYGEIPYFSISRGEQFARCQFAYFMKYGMKAEPRMVADMRPEDAGTMMHEIIEQFSNYALDVGWDTIEREQCTQKVEQLTKQVLEKHLSERHTQSSRYAYLLGKITRTMDTTLWNIRQYYEQSEFVPLGYEISFDGQQFPPVEVTLKDGRVAKLVGKIDRADVWHTPKGDYVSIVDYKSSAKDMDYTQVLAGMQIQLPIYLDTLCRSLCDSGVQAMPASMLYYAIADPVLRGDRYAQDAQIAAEIQKELRMKGLALMEETVIEGLGKRFMMKPKVTAQQIDQLCRWAHKQLGQAIQGVVDGKIDINPARYSGKTSCDWCAYGSVCGFDASLSSNGYRNLSKQNREEFFDHAKLD